MMARYLSCPSVPARNAAPTAPGIRAGCSSGSAKALPEPRITPVPTIPAPHPHRTPRPPLPARPAPPDPPAGPESRRSPAASPPWSRRAAPVLARGAARGAAALSCPRRGRGGAHARCPVPAGCCPLLPAAPALAARAAEPSGRGERRSGAGTGRAGRRRLSPPRARPRRAHGRAPGAPAGTGRGC